MPRFILFVVNTNTYFSVLFNLARRFKASSFAIHIVFDGGYPTLQHDIERCRTARLDFSIRNEYGFSNNYFIRVLQLILSRGSLGKFVKSYLQTLYDIRSIKQLLQQKQPDFIALAADNVAYSTALYIKLGHTLGIKTVVFPQWLANAKEPVEFIINDDDYEVKSVYSKLIARFFPKWTFSVNGKTLLRLPAQKILLKELFGISPKLPWILHSGDADRIALESRAMKAFSRRIGLPDEQTIVTGSLELDMLCDIKKHSAILRHKLYARYGFAKSRPLVITALPPDFYTHTGGRPQSEFKNYRELLNKWIDAFKVNNPANLLVCVHPSVDKKNFSLAETAYMKLCREDLINVLPLGDLFVASVSATIQWAICVNIPTINYDVYQYDYDEYKHVAGVITVRDYHNFKTTLKHLTQRPAEIEELRKKQSKISDMWGTLDGHSFDRIQSLIDSLDKA